MPNVFWEKASGGSSTWKAIVGDRMPSVSTGTWSPLLFSADAKLVTSRSLR